MSKVRSPSTISVNALPPTAVCNASCTCGHADVPHGALFAIDGELEIRLSLDRKDADAFDARAPSSVATATILASRSSSSRSGPKILTEFSPLTPERVSITLSRICCEKFQSTPDDGAVQLALHLARSARSWCGAHGRSLPPATAALDLGPFVLVLQRHQEFGVVEAGRIGAVVGAAHLAEHGLALRDTCATACRAIRERRVTSSSETFTGNVPRMYMLPFFQGRA